MSELKPCPFCEAGLFSGTNVRKKSVMRHPHNPKCPLSEANFLDTPGFRESWNLRAQPANAPLTLDELRGMHREPVWCVSLDADGNVGPCWCHLVERRDGNPFRDWIPPLDKYGKTWLAYRRKPERSEG